MTLYLEERFGGLLILLDDAFDHLRYEFENGGIAATGFALDVLCDMARQASLMYTAFDWVANNPAHPNRSELNSRDFEAVLNFIADLSQLHTP